jgi:hypothetical protein
MLGFVASHVFAMEAFCDYAAALADRPGTDLRLEAAMAKLFCSETGFQVVDRTLQVRGGRGYETEASLRARGETPFPVERLFREARLNSIVEGTSEILRLFLAREALDPHLSRLGALATPGSPFLAKAGAVGSALAHYPLFYAARSLPAVTTPAGLPAALRSPWRSVRRDARALARRIVRAMLRHGAGLEHRQALLGRLVDDGVDLTASALALSRAASRGDAGSAELADLFVRHARARAAARRRVPLALDRAGTRVADGVLAGRYRPLEEGILPYVRE